MDPKVSSRLGVLACLLVAACATPPPKQADSFDDSPPSESGASASRSASGSASSSDDSTSTSTPTSPDPATTAAPPSDDPSGTAAATLPSNLGTGWDRDLTQQELARAARTVKANCGSATDDQGNAKGPWGKTQVSVRLHHHGHSKEAKAEGEYAGTPVGHCIERAFTDLQFPPWEGHDLVIEYDVEVVKPK